MPALQGKNSSVLCYGGVSTGKTYTLEVRKQSLCKASGKVHASVAPFTAGITACRAEHLRAVTKDPLHAACWLFAATSAVYLATATSSMSHTVVSSTAAQHATLCTCFRYLLHETSQWLHASFTIVGSRGCLSDCTIAPCSAHGWCGCNFGGSPCTQHRTFIHQGGLSICGHGAAAALPSGGI